MPAETLGQVLRPLMNVFHPGDHPDLLIGLSAQDDAAVWRLDDERVLIATTDFFTPVVDDPFDYGQIAAANALSDIYAMGGEPFLALNIIALPADLPVEVGAEIIRGGAEKCAEAGVVIAGGHTIRDQEPKYGLAVLGFGKPNRLLTKQGAQPGDALFLTKPIGMGVVTTALKQEKATSEDVEAAVVWMKRLNAAAARAALAHGVRAATDITGFGLLGHAHEMATASGTGLRLYWDAIPLLEGASQYAGMWTFPGGAADNRLFYSPFIHFAASIAEEKQMLLFDPQTSGGLLLAVPAAEREAFRRDAKETGTPAWEIGIVTEEAEIEVIEKQ